MSQRLAVIRHEVFDRDEGGHPTTQIITLHAILPDGNVDMEPIVLAVADESSPEEQAMTVIQESVQMHNFQLVPEESLKQDGDRIYIETLPSFEEAEADPILVTEDESGRLVEDEDEVLEDDEEVNPGRDAIVPSGEELADYFDQPVAGAIDLATGEIEDVSPVPQDEEPDDLVIAQNYTEEQEPLLTLGSNGHTAEANEAEFADFMNRQAEIDRLTFRDTPKEVVEDLHPPRAMLDQLVSLMSRGELPRKMFLIGKYSDYRIGAMSSMKDENECYQVVLEEPAGPGTKWTWPVKGDHPVKLEWGD